MRCLKKRFTSHLEKHLFHPAHDVRGREGSYRSTTSTAAFQRLRTAVLILIATCSCEVHVGLEVRDPEGKTEGRLGLPGNNEEGGR